MSMQRGACCCRDTGQCWQLFQACPSPPCETAPSARIRVDLVPFKCIPQIPFGQLVVYQGICYTALGVEGNDTGEPVVEYGDLAQNGWKDCVDCCDEQGCWYECTPCPGELGPTVYITCDERDAHPGQTSFLWQGVCYQIGKQVSVLGGDEVDPTIYFADCTACDPATQCCDSAHCADCAGTYTVQIDGVKSGLQAWDKQLGQTTPCVEALPCDGFAVPCERFGGAGACEWRAIVTDTSGDCAAFPVQAPCTGGQCSVNVGTPDNVKITCENNVPKFPPGRRWQVALQAILMGDEIGGVVVPGCSAGGICGDCGPGISAVFVSEVIDGTCGCPGDVSYQVDLARTQSWFWSTMSISVG